MPALRIIGQLTVANTQEIIDRCLWCSVLDKMVILMKYLGDANMIKECCWALSNIAAGSHHQIEKLVENEAFLILKEIALNSKKLANKNEAIWTITNAATGCDSSLRIRMLELTNAEILSVLVMGLNSG